MKNIFIKLSFLAIIMMIGANLNAQNLEGTVYELKDGKKTPLPYVQVYWSGTNLGTTTTSKGEFTIARLEKDSALLVVSFVGLQPDTLSVRSQQQDLEIVLSVNNLLKTIIISETRVGTYISRLNPIFTENITDDELCRAACCNLSESFETNASVDVSYSDAVTGAKRIQLLGLTGTYIQMLTENNPTFRGLAHPYAMSYIPGSWMAGIQVSKGSASVVNGYQSLAGQINVEYKKPEKSEKIYINVLGSSAGKMEMNINGSIIFNKKWSTILMGHIEDLRIENDNNNDGFLDAPKLYQTILYSSTFYSGKRDKIRFGAKYLEETRIGGQTGFDEDLPADINNKYRTQIKTKRYEGFLKWGHTFEFNSSHSLALVSNFFHHNIESFYGLKNYNASQNTAYANLIYQIWPSSDKYKLNYGLNFTYDQFDETFIDDNIVSEEMTYGAFSEFTYNKNDKFTVLGGLRADYHNNYGFFITPRLHFKWDITKQMTMRLSAGKGSRSPHAIAENAYYLSSNRNFVFVEDPQMEVAWNYGINIIKYFEVNGKPLSLSAEYYRTDFVNQYIVDIDQDQHSVYFYNLDGKSYANSMQVELNWEIIRGLDFNLAYRYLDVKTSFDGNLISKPLSTNSKALASASYKTKLEKWQFDYTVLYTGSGRMPTYQADGSMGETELYDGFFTMNAQITKYFYFWNIYLGVENLTNFTQENPIVAADMPFGSDFDATQVWGPLHGRKIFLGLRFQLDRD